MMMKVSSDITPGILIDPEYIITSAIIKKKPIKKRKKKCKREECSKSRWKIGLCRNCYQKREQSDVMCKIENCTNTIQTHYLCNIHYKETICITNNCTNVVKIRKYTMCLKCYRIIHNIKRKKDI